MRLLLVTPEFPPHSGGGLLRYYANLVPGLARAGCRVTVLVAAPFADEFPGYETDDGVRICAVGREAIDAADRSLAHLSAPAVFRRWLAAGWAAYRWAEGAGAFDLVETTDFGLGFVPFVVGSPGVPVVVRAHGSLGQISIHEPRRSAFDLDAALARLTEATVLPLADDVQTYARTNAREWSARLGREVATVRPAVPVPPDSAGSQASAAAVIVGRVQAWKGPEVLCGALRRLDDGTCPVVSWIGRDTQSADDGGSLDADLRCRYPDVWGPRVERHGELAFEEVAGLMARARFVIVPSVWDVFNFTAVEAMAAGRVVVCSTGAGAHEIIAHGENGLIATAGSIDSLAEAIRVAAGLSDRERAQMGTAARETVRRFLDPDAAAGQHLDRYRACRVREAVCPDWIRSFYEPSSTASVTLDFLEQVGVRDLAGHVTSRVRRRILDTRSGSLS